MPVTAHVRIDLDVPYGSVDYAVLDTLIGEALRAHHFPVLDIEVEGIAPLGDPLGGNALGPEDRGPFSQRPVGAPAPPSPFQ